MRSRGSPRPSRLASNRSAACGTPRFRECRILAPPCVQLNQGTAPPFSGTFSHPGSLALWDWRKEVRDGGSAFPPVRDVVIQLQDEQHRNVYKWKLTNAWCCKLSGPALKGQGNELAIETMELAYDRIDIS